MKFFKKHKVLTVVLIVLIIVILLGLSAFIKYKQYEDIGNYDNFLKLTESDKGKKVLCVGEITYVDNDNGEIIIKQYRDGEHNYEPVEKAISIEYDTNIYPNGFNINNTVLVLGEYTMTFDDGIIWVFADTILDVTGTM